MQIDERQIRAIVEEVVGELVSGTAPRGQSSIVSYPGVFGDIEKAIQAAHRAFAEYRGTPVQTRREIITRVRATIAEHVEEISRLAVDETRLGRADDKVKKNLLAAEKTPGVEDLESLSETDEFGMTLTERAPYGLIGAITPSTNPTESIICNAIGMIAAGNSVVFNAHPSAKRVSALTVGLINQAIEEAGGPRNLVTTVSNPTIESAQHMMHHQLEIGRAHV